MEGLDRSEQTRLTLAETGWGCSLPSDLAVSNEIRRARLTC